MDFFAKHTSSVAGFAILILFLIVFGTYIAKNTYGVIYKGATGKDLPTSFYEEKPRWYGTYPDYNYKLAKNIIEGRG